MGPAVGRRSWDDNHDVFILIITIYFSINSIIHIWRLESSLERTYLNDFLFHLPNVWTCSSEETANH